MLSSVKGSVRGGQGRIKEGEIRIRLVEDDVFHSWMR